MGMHLWGIKVNKTNIKGTDASLVFELNVCLNADFDNV